MIEVTQTILHLETPGRYGNCLQAAVASLLELPIEDVPHFAQYDNADHALLWWDALVGWVHQAGWEAAWLDEAPGEELCIIGGKSPRGVNHVCVGRGDVVVWDPHPSRDGLLSVEDWITLRPATCQVCGYPAEHFEIVEEP
jgi:hypothetical protein